MEAERNNSRGTEVEAADEEMPQLDKKDDDEKPTRKRKRVDATEHDDSLGSITTSILQGSTPTLGCKGKAKTGKPRVLYLFAGEKRRGTIADILKSKGWSVVEVDILRSKKHDLTIRKFANSIRTRIQANEFAALVLTPPCDTYTRVKYANNRGPPPTRSATYPRGFPWLRGALLRQTQLGNQLTDLSFELLELQLQNQPGLCIQEHPEDLGVMIQGPWTGTTPASIWQRKDFVDLVRAKKLKTFGIRQSDFCAPYVKPTRIATNGLDLDERFYEGLPSFNADGTYCGPIPREINNAQPLISLARQPGDSGFRTTGTAAWPQELDRTLADALDEAFHKFNDARKEMGITVEIGEREEGEAKAREKRKEGDDDSTPIHHPPPTYNPGGRGSPRMTEVLGKVKEFHDGGGLCSPGRWKPADRIFPVGKRWDDLRGGILEILRDEFKDDKKGIDGDQGIQRTLLRLACTPKDTVFKPELLERVRKAIQTWLKKQAGDVEEKLAEWDQAPGQPFFLRTISLLLREANDPDYTFFEYIKDGVTTGVTEPLPHTPAVFERQEKWRLEFDPFDVENVEARNYGSLEDFKDQVQKQFEEEESLGMMKKYSNEEYYSTFGTATAVSPLAVIQEADKIRVIHDGTHKTRLNHKIRVQDKLRAPGAKEKFALLREYKEAKRIPFSLLADYSKAHRRIKILRKEWGYLGCRLNDTETWVHCVGAFGIGSAAYWWGRAAAGLVRLQHAVLGPQYLLDILLFADDSEYLPYDAKAREGVVLAIVTVLSLGAPMKDQKFRGGFQVNWIGMHVNYAEYSLGLSAARAAWLVGWITKILTEGKVDATEMAGGIGRLNYAAQALLYERPWLGPLYSWLGAIRELEVPKVSLPWGVRLILTWIKKRLESGGRQQVVSDRPQVLKELFRSDAKAENGKAWIGGWETAFTTDPKKARWYAIEVEPSWAPWVWSKKNDPNRVIAALELLGTLMCVKLFADKWPRNLRSWMMMQASTDNKGNDFILQKLMSTKFPIAPLLIELAEELRGRQLELNLIWKRRDTNIEADALTNLDFTFFSPVHRIEVVGASIQWKVLDEVMNASEEIFRQVVEEREKKSAKPKWNIFKRKTKARDRLKTKDPW